MPEPVAGTEENCKEKGTENYRVCKKRDYQV